MHSCASSGEIGKEMAMDMTSVTRNDAFAMNLTDFPVSPLLARIAGGQRKNGVDRGPDALWSAASRELLRGLNIEAIAGADVSEQDLGLMPALAQLADDVERIARGGHRPLTLGGDHSIALSTLEGMLRVHPDLRVIFIDAHGDINTPNTSLSGSLHGMPLAAHLGLFGEREMPGIGFVGARLRPNQLGFIGVRDLDHAEATFIDDRSIQCFSSEDVKSFGMTAVIDQVLEHIDPEGKYPLHVSFDVDAADPSVAPATGSLVSGGLDENDLAALAARLSETGRVAALDIAEVNPALAENDAALEKTVHTALTFAADCLK